MKNNVATDKNPNFDYFVCPGCGELTATELGTACEDSMCQACDAAYCDCNYDED